MEAPKDVVALFHSAFHPTRGNIVDFSLKIRDDVSLDGVEFSSLPSGLHLVDQDVIHFTKDGLCGIAVFRRRRTKEDGLRGVRLGAVGVLIGSAPRARPWLHLPHLKRLAAHLEDTPEDWGPLTEYYEAHKQPDIIPDESTLDLALWSGWEHELSTASPNHPLHHLPCLLHAFGPSIMTLFRFVLARRRVLIYTRVPVPPSRQASFNSLASRFSESTRHEDSRGNSIDQTAAEAGAAPVVEPACVLARVAADICFGWRSEMDVPGLGAGGEGAIPVLGMVGLDSIEKLGEESMKRTGWIACTTERIFLEKPYLYDLVVDLSPSLLAHSPQTKPAASPDDKPVLSVSVPTSTSTSSLSTASQSYKLAPTRPTFSDLRIFGDIERALYSQPGCSHQHAPQPHTNRSTTSLCGCVGEHEVEEGWVVWDRWGQGCSASTHGPPAGSSPAHGPPAGSSPTHGPPAGSSPTHGPPAGSSPTHGPAGSSPVEEPPAALIEPLTESPITHLDPAMLVTGNRQSCAAGMNDGPCSSGLNGHGRTDSGDESLSRSVSVAGGNSSVLRSWIDPWKIYEEVCMFCSGICTWIGFTSPRPHHTHNIQLDGPDEALTSHNRQPQARPAPSTHLSAEERRAQRRAHVLELMTIFHKYAAFLHARLGDIVDTYDALPQSPRKTKSSSGTKSTLSSKSLKSAFSARPLLGGKSSSSSNGGDGEPMTLVLTSKDMLALELSPLSASDAQFLEWLAEGVLKMTRKSERRVVVKRTWRDMVVAVVGSPW